MMIDKTFEEYRDQCIHYGEKMLEFLAKSCGPREKVLSYLLANSDKKTNKVDATYSEIADNMAVSYNTVKLFMSKLLEVDFIRRVTKGVWMLNPKMTFNDRIKNYQDACSEYESLPRETEKQ